MTWSALTHPETLPETTHNHGPLTCSTVKTRCTLPSSTTVSARCTPPSSTPGLPTLSGVSTLVTTSTPIKPPPDWPVACDEIGFRTATANSPTATGCRIAGASPRLRVLDPTMIQCPAASPE